MQEDPAVWVGGREQSEWFDECWFIAEHNGVLIEEPPA